MEKATKHLIAVEIEIGFLYIPAKLKKYFPNEKKTIPFVLDGEKKELSYNPKYRRITGLVGFYRKHEAAPNDAVDIEVGDRTFSLAFKKVTEKEKNLLPVDEEKAEEILNVSELSSQAKGNIVEQRIAELILLYGQGLLNVYKPIVDIEGIDLVVLKRGVFQPLFIQVKGKYKLRNKQFQIGVKKKGFVPHHTFFVVGAYFSPETVDIADYLIFIPSKDFQEKAVEVRKDTDDALYVLNCRLAEAYNGQYTPYLVKKENLVNKIFEKFSEIEKYLK